MRINITISVPAHTSHKFLRSFQHMGCGEVQEHGKGDAGLLAGLEEGADGKEHLL